MGHFFFEIWGREGFDISAVVAENQVAIDLVVLLKEPFAFLQPCYHASGGIGVCCHAFICQDCCAKKVVDSRFAGARVNGVGVADAVNHY